MDRKYTFESGYAEEIVSLIRKNSDPKILINKLNEYHENDIAEAFEELTCEERKVLYRILDSERISEIFTYIDDASIYLAEMEQEKIVEVFDNMDSDDAVDLLEELDEVIRDSLLDLMDDENSEAIKLIQSYDADQIGSKMTTNFIMISKGLTVKQAMRELISQAEDNDNIFTVYVSDEDNRFYGAIDLKDLITARDYVDLETLIHNNYPYVRDKDIVSECLEKIKDYAEDSIAVLDSDDHILGVITAQDVIEAVDDELGDDYAKLAGLTEEESLNETLADSMKKRLPWLVVLLFLGIGISSVVGIFEAVVSQIAVIVCFQSLILNMAGNVGTQSLAVTIRMLMDEDLKSGQKAWLIFKEMRVGLCNGLLLGLLSFIILGLYIYFIKGYEVLFAFAISGCVGLALVLAMVISGFVGTFVPIFFNKIKIDPAVASGPLITTVNDLVAVVAYYGLVWLLLIRI